MSGSPTKPQSRGGRFDREWTLHDQRDAIETVQRSVAEALHERGYDEAAAFAIRLALEEALVNGFRHGNHGDPTKSVTIRCGMDSNRVEFEVEDQGEGFDPRSIPDPTAEENIEIPSGRGIMLMRAYMAVVEFLPPGNKLRIVYERKQP
ncbi:MAG: ATP-binding protein [Phycisphaerae bacterium]|nr:ATP-binding protein [Phycisphaerae bacterium]